MAVFDLAQQRMCVRVVYDGAANAGKTTNLQHLAELFATQRTCELYSPAAMDGRTLYFDWLEIAAGMVCGFPLLCQVITVPGQLVLTPRRRHLLHTADVVVHVVDGGDQAIERAREGLALFDELERERGAEVPLVIQANKQDQRGAVSGAAILASLDRPPLPVVEAIASDGIGVVDTFVTAVRAAVRSIQARVERGDVRVAVRSAQTAEEAYEDLAAERLDPEWAIEMMLEEASNALALGTDVSAADADEPATWRPSVSTEALASFPTDSVPTGFVWPAHTGRQVLRALASARPAKSPVALDGDGSARVVVGEFVLSTGVDGRFDNAESARQALVRSAREWTQLHTLLAPETVLVVEPAIDASFLWTILPRMTSVADVLSSRSAEVDPRPVLASFGEALVDALGLQAHHGLELDLSPRAYGVRNGALLYTGELVRAGASPRDVRRAVVEALAEVAALGVDVEPIVASIESALAAKLSSDALAVLERASTWSPDGAIPQAMLDVSARIERMLRARGRAA